MLSLLVSSICTYWLNYWLIVWSVLFSVYIVADSALVFIFSNSDFPPVYIQAISRNSAYRPVYVAAELYMLFFSRDSLRPSRSRHFDLELNWNSCINILYNNDLMQYQLNIYHAWYNFKNFLGSLLQCIMLW